MMQAIAIDQLVYVKKNNNKYPTKTAYSTKEKEQYEEIVAFVFAIDNIKFAFRLSNVKQVLDTYSNIFKVSHSNNVVLGFLFDNNRLVPILKLESLLNFVSTNNNSVLIEIYRGNTEVGIYINDSYSINNILNPLKIQNNNLKYRFIENIAKLNEENVFLIDEIELFKEIKKQIMFLT